MTDRYEQTAFAAMLETVNEWHRKVGIDDVMKTKLTRAIADTVATGIFQRHLRTTRDAAIEEAAVLVYPGAEARCMTPEEVATAIRALKTTAE